MKSRQLKMNRNSLKTQMQNELKSPCQPKSLQFRSIAPKTLPVVSTPTVLSCQSPSALPDASAAVSPKSIIVPAQNYALMQVAGQEGTFSLVALSPSMSPPSPQQQAPKGLPLLRNLKLPIPRYRQPARSKTAPEKSATAPAVPQVPSPAKVAPSALRTLPPECLESPCKAEPSEQLIVIDSGTSEISVATLLSENTVLYSGSGVARPADTDQVASASLPGDSFVTKVEEEETRFQPCLSKPARQPASSVTVLSPAVFGKAVQIIPSPPKGKLPILPYSKVKSTLLPVAKINEKSFLETQCGVGDSSDLTTSSAGNTEMFFQKQMANSAHQSLLQAKTIGLSGAASLQKSAGKKRGRKRKTIEDILAFEARKKRSLSFFRRRVPEKPTPVPAVPKEKAVEISKKYRSIRPKPVLVMETVPQLVGLSSFTPPECLEPELLIGHRLPSRALGCLQPGQASDRVAPLYFGARQPHRCLTCGRCFQFKHHLQSHMNSHTNSRPYACPVCRKAYAHSGSLSTHMKLHHSEGRPRKALQCEFCEKAFGYVGVYFGHLREVHKVILTVEPSISHHEEDVPIEGMTPPDSTDEQAQEQEDPVELQIKCGRCQAITPTFADMKLHLLYVHGEEVQVRLSEGALQGGRQAEDELVKHAAHYWRQLNERRNLVRCGTCEEEFFSFSKLKKHIYSHHQGELEVTVECDEGGGEMLGVAAGARPEASDEGVALGTSCTFHCVLCSEVLDSREEVLEHWGGQHRCEDPAALWAVLGPFVEREEINLSAHCPQQQETV